MLYIRALLYLIAVAVLVAAAVFLTENPGSVQVTWLGYDIQASFGIFLIAVAVLLAAMAVVGRES